MRFGRVMFEICEQMYKHVDHRNFTPVWGGENKIIIIIIKAFI